MLNQCEWGSKRLRTHSARDVLAKHVHAHVDVSSGGLVCWVKAHSNSPLVVLINVGGTRIAKTKVLQEHAEIESFLGNLRSRDVLAFLRT
jgi:hypothetical protein